MLQLHVLLLLLLLQLLVVLYYLMLLLVQLLLCLLFRLLLLVSLVLMLSLVLLVSLVLLLLLKLVSLMLLQRSRRLLLLWTWCLLDSLRWLLLLWRYTSGLRGSLALGLHLGLGRSGRVRDGRSRCHLRSERFRFWLGHCRRREVARVAALPAALWCIFDLGMGMTLRYIG